MTRNRGGNGGDGQPSHLYRRGFKPGRITPDPGRPRHGETLADEGEVAGCVISFHFAEKPFVFPFG